MIAALILLAVGVLTIALGGALLLNSARIGDKIRPRTIGHDRPIRRFAAENMDLIAAVIIVAGLAVGIGGGLIIANETYALPPIHSPP